MVDSLDADRPVRWGILGAGSIAATVAADIAASPDSLLQAVGARDGERAAAFARRLGIGASYGSYADLVADPEVDVIYVATTHAQHHEHALLALRADKPALVEKAFTLNAREAREVVDEARHRELFCMEAMWMRFNPLVRRAQQAVSDGAIGEIVGVRAELSRHFPYDPAHRLYDVSAGGGALLDLGIYPATFGWLFLGPPETVHATGLLSPTGSDATTAMQWGYPDGRYAQLVCSTRGESPFSALITGTDGWISVSGWMHNPSSLTIGSSDGEQVISAASHPHPYRHEVAEVERCLRAGELESSVVPLDDTVAILEVLDDVRAQVGVRYPADGTMSSRIAG